MGENAVYPHVVPADVERRQQTLQMLLLSFSFSQETRLLKETRSCVAVKVPLTLVICIHSTWHKMIDSDKRVSGNHYTFLVGQHLLYLKEVGVDMNDVPRTQ